MLKEQRFILISSSSHLRSRLRNTGKNTTLSIIVTVVDCTTSTFLFSCKLPVFICMKCSLGCCDKNILSACHIINWQWSHTRITVFWVIFVNITILTSSCLFHMPTECHSEKYLRELRRLAVSSNYYFFPL